MILSFVPSLAYLRHPLFLPRSSLLCSALRRFLGIRFLINKILPVILFIPIILIHRLVTFHLEQIWYAKSKCFFEIFFYFYCLLWCLLLCISEGYFSKIATLNTLKATRDKLIKQQQSIRTRYYSARDKEKELYTIKRNVDIMLEDRSHERNRDRSVSHER